MIPSSRSIGRRRRLGVAVVGVLLFVLAACGEGDTPNATSGGDAGGSPLEQLLGISSDPGQLGADASDLSRRAEEAIADCMAEQGFEYVPFDPMSGGEDVGELLEGQGTREWAERWGYGISTTYSAFESLEHDEVAADPNQAIFEAMTPAEQAAYTAALYGDFGVEPPAFEVDVTDAFDTSESGGCQADGSSLLENEFGGAFLREFDHELEALYERFLNDPRTTEAVLTWRSCMADRGYSYPSPDNAQGDIVERMNALFTFEDAEAFEESTDDGGCG